MKIFRIRDNSGVIGAVASTDEDAARAYALGKYGAGSEVERVAVCSFCVSYLPHY